MIDEFSEEWEVIGEDILMPDLLAWIGSVQLTEHEAVSIKTSILENVTGYRKGWLELMSARIERTIACSQRRIDQAVTNRLQLHTDRIDRRLITVSGR